MVVKIANRVLRVDQQEYQRLLKMASELVPFGVYAVIKQDYTELCNDRCDSITQLKQKIRMYRKAGCKVLSNGRI